MAESSECLENGSGGVCEANGIHSNYDDDKIGENVDIEEGLEGGLTVLEKHKKNKKKHKGGLQSPQRILAFSTSELSRLDEQKAEMTKKCAVGVKALFKSATFPISGSPFKDKYLIAGGCGDLEDTKEDAMSSSPDMSSVLTRATSLPLKSALRGGYEELGMGPRPKLKVKWDQNVWEPPCSTVSHTVKKNLPKKKAMKHHRHKAKSSSDDLHKKHGKKKPPKSKCSSGPSMARAHHADGHKEVISCSSLHGDSSSEDRCQMLARRNVLSVVSSLGFTEVECHKGGDLAEGDSSFEGVARVVTYPLESMCGGSCFGAEMVSCNLRHAKAM